MNIKLKRVVRTPHSEEIDIFDTDMRDEHDDVINIGKLEVHYLDDQAVGTLLIWQEFAQGYNRQQGGRTLLDDLIEAIMSEVTEPIGVSSEYGIEVYFPSVINHSFASNYSDEAEDEDDEPGSEDNEAEGEENEVEQDDADDVQPPHDDFYRKLTERP